jgi:hypothetical protein
LTLSALSGRIYVCKNKERVMKNKILALTREAIPYVPWLRPVAGSVAGCILMQQLDHRFAQKPHGFYKFLVPCPGHDHYRQGDSWREELGLTPAEFRTAFDKIGIRYTSKREFEDAGIGADHFQAKLYCSYHDKIKGLTWYYRNDALVDAVLDELVAGTYVAAPSPDT